MPSGTDMTGSIQGTFCSHYNASLLLALNIYEGLYACHEGDKSLTFFLVDQYYSIWHYLANSYCNIIRDATDSLYRDSTDTQYMQYLSKAS